MIGKPCYKYKRTCIAVLHRIQQFSTEEPFDPSLFVDFRKRMGIEQINSINEKILGLSKSDTPKESENTDDSEDQDCGNTKVDESSQQETSVPENTITHKGKLITDATACPLFSSFINNSR